MKKIQIRKREREDIARTRKYDSRGLTNESIIEISENNKKF